MTLFVLFTIYRFQLIFRNCLKYSRFASLLYYCASCARGFRSVRGEEKKPPKKKTQQNRKHQQDETREISGFGYFLSESVLKRVSFGGRIEAEAEDCYRFARVRRWNRN